MAIPNPNPNIKDGVIVDNKTWSSSKIAEGFNAAGVDVGSDGSLAPKQMKLLANVTLTEASYTYTIDITDATELFAVVDVTFAANTNTSFNFSVTSPENSNEFGPGTYCNRSFTGGSEFHVALYAQCKNGVALGYGCAPPITGSGNLTMSFLNNYTSNIVCSKFLTAAIQCSEKMPVGTKIKVYGY